MSNKSLVDSDILQRAIEVLRRANKTIIASRLEKASAKVCNLTPDDFINQTADKVILNNSVRPDFCGTGHCSCIECLFAEPAFKGLIKR